MQTILGANGTIGNELSRLLPDYTKVIRQVSRNPKKVNASDETVSADLLDYIQTERAVAGSDIVYLVAGLKYDTKVWQAQWPKVMRNTIDACKKHNSKLVFFDNVYAYGHVVGPMTEDTPFNPNSKKGEVRAKVAAMLLEEIKLKNLSGMIVRSADFYGPKVTQSITHTTVIERLKKGKTPQWIGDSKTVHSFTFTPDAGRSLAILGNTPNAFNQSWHVLTSGEKITGQDFIRIACNALGRSYNGVRNLPKFAVQILGLFIPILGELSEMMYQFENDYIFDCSKLEKFLQIKATSYQNGIDATMKAYI